MNHNSDAYNEKYKKHDYKNAAGWFVGRSVGRSVDWSVGRSVGWCVGWSVGRSVGPLIYWLIGYVPENSSNHFQD